MHRAFYIDVDFHMCLPLFMHDVPNSSSPLPSPAAADSHVQSSRPSSTLVLGTTAHGELKVAGSACQLTVDLRVGVKSVVNTTSLLLVQHDLQHLAAILLGSQSLADNLNWVDDIGKDSVMDSSQSSGSRSLLCLAASGSVGSLWSWEDTA